MKKLGGSVVKKAPAKKPTTKTSISKLAKKEEGKERMVSEVAKKLSGLDLSKDTVTKMLQDLDISTDKEWSEDDLFLIYQVLSEPLLSKEERKVEFGEILLTGQKYTEQILEVSNTFEGGFVSQRIQALYENLPSLETNRINFMIDKDIYRNKPLLGKGLFECRRCKSSNTFDYQQQTRSADEPMTSFVHCKDCGASFTVN